jgi:hypothetical protein
MDTDLFCEDFYQAPDEKVVKLVTQLLAWKRQNLMLYPNDVLNMLIDNDLITKYDIQNIIDDVEKKTLDISLPTSYIS